MRRTSWPPARHAWPSAPRASAIRPPGGGSPAELAEPHPRLITPTGRSWSPIRGTRHLVSAEGAGTSRAGRSYGNPEFRKPLQTQPIRSSSPNQPEAQVEVQLNSPDFCVWGVDSRASSVYYRRPCRPPPRSPAKTQSAGLAPERSLTQRMDALKRANEIRTRRARLKRDLKAGRAPDPRPAARSARIPAHGQGLRPAAGGAEVRPREGEPDPHALPHLAEQDDRRPLRAPAQRARLVPAPLGRVSHRRSSSSPVPPGSARAP